MTALAHNTPMDAGSLVAVGAVQSMAIPGTGKLAHFMPVGSADPATGVVHLVRDDYSSKLIHHMEATAKADKKLAAMGNGHAADLQRRGMGQYNHALNNRPLRQAQHYAALKAAPKVVAAPAPQMALPKTMTVQASSLSIAPKQAHDTPRQNLRLVSSNPGVTKPAASQPSGFSKRYNQLAGMSGFCYG